MDSIMQWTQFLPTAIATFTFASTVLLGIWIAARFGRKIWIAAATVTAVSFGIRFGVEPLSGIGIFAMSIFHISAATLLGLWLMTKKNLTTPSAK